MTASLEWLDVVDEKDRVIDRAPRDQVHAKGFRHRAVHILLRNRQGHVFLQRRSFLKDTFPGCWDSSASGHVESGEDYDTAMRRELQEEIGWSPGPDETLPEPILRLPAQPLTGAEFVWVYAGTTEGPFELNPSEIIEGRWLPPAEISSWIDRDPAAFADAFRLIWSKI